MVDEIADHMNLCLLKHDFRNPDSISTRVVVTTMTKRWRVVLAISRFRQPL